MVTRALEKLAPKLVEEKEKRRHDRIEQLYLVRNRVLSFIFETDVAVAPYWSITRMGKLILLAILLAFIAVSIIGLR